MERMGLRPLLVQGSPFNIKVTRAADLQVAARILQSAEKRTMSGKCESDRDSTCMPSARAIMSCSAACASPTIAASSRTRTAMW